MSTVTAAPADQRQLLAAFAKALKREAHNLRLGPDLLHFVG
jgi:hypothetical protein